jgi:uncharacterized protein (DUF983 family)
MASSTSKQPKVSQEQRLLACPCCGSGAIYAGIVHAQAMGVRCTKCGLRIEQRYPDRWPAGMKALPADEKWKALETATLNKAIAAWNRRT